MRFLGWFQLYRRIGLFGYDFLNLRFPFIDDGDVVFVSEKNS